MKIFSSFLIPLLIVFFLFGVAQATSQPVELPNPLQAENVFDLLDSIAQLIFVAGLAISPVFLIWGAFMFITAAGDARKAQSAINIIKYTVIGFLVVIFARALTFLITNVIGG